MKNIQNVVAVWFVVLLVANQHALSSTQIVSTDAANVLKNGGFEEKTAEGRPSDWIFRPELIVAGYTLVVDDVNPQHGSLSAMIDATKVSLRSGMFGNLMQSIDAKRFQGKRIRFRAAVRTAELVGDARAQLWLRVDREMGEESPVIGAFDNMDDRPIREIGWKHFDIVADVDVDALQINVGILVLGEGKAWIDDASLEIVAVDAAVTARSNQANADAVLSTQPFFVRWLAFPLIGLALLGLSHAGTTTINRFAFRFSLAYWLLYCLPTPIGTLLPVFGYKFESWYQVVPVDTIVRWTALNVLEIKGELVSPVGNGSGDTTFAFIQVLVYFVLAIIIAFTWSVMERLFHLLFQNVGQKKQKLGRETADGPTDYRRLKDLLRSFLRYVLAFTLLGYGLAKVGTVQNQFPPLSYDQLSRTYGDSSPMGLLWTFMSSSQGYTFFAGLGEIIAAILLVWRRTILLGAVVAAGVMFNVVMLNFCYDVPVKLYSFHLLVMALFIALPDATRLANFFFWNQTTEAVAMRPPYAGRRTIWMQRVAKAYIVALGIGFPLYSFATRERNAAAEKLAEPRMVGAWQVEEFLLDGKPVPPQDGDATRWKTFNVMRFPWAENGEAGSRDFVSIRMMDRTNEGGQVKISSDERVITMKNGASGSVPGELNCELSGVQLTITGQLGGKPLIAKLRRAETNDFLLMKRGFRWINERPYNR